MSRSAYALLMLTNSFCKKGCRYISFDSEISLLISRRSTAEGWYLVSSGTGGITSVRLENRIVKFLLNTTQERTWYSTKGRMDEHKTHLNRTAQVSNIKWSNTKLTLLLIQCRKSGTLRKAWSLPSVACSLLSWTVPSPKFASILRDASLKL